MDPANQRALIGLAKSQADQGRFWDSLVNLDKVTAPGGLKKIYDNNRKIVIQNLILQYRQLLKEDPDNGRLHYSLGIVYAKQGRYDLAIEQYTNSLFIEPDFKDALFNLASAYKETGNNTEAIATFKEVLSLEDQDHTLDQHACYHLAEIYAKMGESEKSVRYREMAQEFEKNK